jgi:hypothetical protein
VDNPLNHYGRGGCSLGVEHRALCGVALPDYCNMACRSARYAINMVDSALRGDGFDGFDLSKRDFYALYWAKNFHFTLVFVPLHRNFATCQFLDYDNTRVCGVMFEV